jgi:hypothetical protein
MAAEVGRITLTAGNIRNFHIYLRTIAQLIPEGGIGGSSVADLGSPFNVTFSPGETIETDVAGDKMILRNRRAVRGFLEATAAEAGDVVVIERSGDRELSVWLEEAGSGANPTAVQIERSTNDRANVERQLSRADDWIRETFSAIAALARPHTVSERDEGGPGRQFRFRNGGFIRVHPRLARRIVLGFPKGMTTELRARGLLIEREDLSWMNFDQGMDLTVVRELVAQAVK